MSNRNVYILPVILLTMGAIMVSTQVINANRRYCFNFTWLGPDYSNASNFQNATCDDVTKLSKNVPCREPLVVTYDSTPPDLDYLWKNYDSQVSCLLTDGDVCVAYTYIFSGVVRNVTYMCTRVVDEDGSTIKSGKLSSYRGSWVTHVDICRSYPGAMPCSSAFGIFSISLSIQMTVLAFALWTTYQAVY